MVHHQAKGVLVTLSRWLIMRTRVDHLSLMIACIWVQSQIPDCQVNETPHGSRNKP